MFCIKTVKIGLKRECTIRSARGHFCKYFHISKETKRMINELEEMLDINSEAKGHFVRYKYITVMII